MSWGNIKGKTVGPPSPPRRTFEITLPPSLFPRKHAKERKKGNFPTNICLRLTFVATLFKGPTAQASPTSSSWFITTFLHFRIILREAEVRLLICLIFLACEVRKRRDSADKLPLIPKLWRIIFAPEIQEVSCLMCCTARHLACERVKNSNHPNNCRPIYSSSFFLEA